MGLLSCVLSIVAIELILKWNKVGGVYSITSTGQYLPLIIGVCSFVSVWWSLVRQESVSAASTASLRSLLTASRNEDVTSNVAMLSVTGRMALKWTLYLTLSQTLLVMPSLSPTLGFPPTAERFQTPWMPMRKKPPPPGRLLPLDHRMRSS